MPRACGTPTSDPTELYYLPDDFTQAKDLAAEHPEKVKELKDLFWQEAEKYNVLPLMAPLAGFFGMLPPLPDIAKYEFRGDVQNVLSGMIPRVYNHSYTISAELVIPQGGAEGVIVAEADHMGGFSLFVDDGKLTHTYSMMGVFVFRQQAEEPLPEGEVTVRMEFVADEAKPATGGEVTLFIDDRPVGKGRMDHTVPIRFSGYAGMDIGRDNGGVVDLGYESRKPFAFTGTIKKVVFDVNPHAIGRGGARTPHGRPPRPHRARAHRVRRERTRRIPMKLHDTIDVLIGGYLSKDAAEEDYNAVLDCGGHLQGAVVVSKDLEGNLSVEQTDHMVREGAEGLGAVGFAVGLFAPPLLAATAIGAAIGAARRRFAAPQGRRQARRAGGSDDPDRRSWPDHRVLTLRGREGRTRCHTCRGEGRRRGRRQPRPGAEGRAGGRPAEDGRIRRRLTSPAWSRPADETRRPGNGSCETRSGVDTPA